MQHKYYMKKHLKYSFYFEIITITARDYGFRKDTDLKLFGCHLTSPNNQTEMK